MFQSFRHISTTRWLFIALLSACSFVALSRYSPAAGTRHTARRPTLEALFSPGGGCVDRLIEEISRARKAIRIQVYLFTSKPIADALIKAHKRGVDVKIILDKSQERMTYGRFRVLRRAGIDVYFDGEHATANNKIMLIDHRTVITGSYNYTKAAEEKNAENILIIKNDSQVTDEYHSNFDRHLAHSKKFH